MTTLEYPAVVAESDDWQQYIDEWTSYSSPDFPGIVIIDQAGKFYAVRFGEYNTTEGVDWVARRINELLGGRTGVDAILALDRSGSMSGAPPSGSTDPKIDILKDAVGLFMDVWEANVHPDDRVGVTDFASDVTQYTHGTGSAATQLVPLNSYATAVKSYVNGLTTGGFTCVGGATAVSLDELALSTLRHIILFSDGMQNYNPVIADTVVNKLEIRTISASDVSSYDLVNNIYGDSGVPEKPGQTLYSFDTRIHTIGVGLSGHPWSTLMSRISSRTSGAYYETPAPAADLQNFYLNVLLELFKGASPQLVKSSSGTYSPGGAGVEDTCSINSSASWLTIALTWQGDPEGNRLVCNLEAPDGTLMDIHSRTRTDVRRRVVNLPLPAYNYGRMVDHAGEWKLHIMGTGGSAIPYQVFWIVDDHVSRLEIEKYKWFYKLGDTLKLKAKLVQGDKALPLDHIQNAVMELATPAVDLDRFVNGLKLKPMDVRILKRDHKDLKSASDRDLKLAFLSRQPRAVANLSRMDVKAVPIDYRKGYLTRTIELTKPGIHRVKLRLKALDSNGYRIQRERTLNFFVNP